MPIINTVIAGGGTTPTGTISITTNGTHDVTNYANADVSVPTTAPSSYIKYEVSNNELIKSQENHLDLSGVKSIQTGGLAYAYYNGSHNGLTTLDLSNVKTLQGDSLLYACYACLDLTHVICGVESVCTNYGVTREFYAAFNRCGYLTLVEFTNLKTIGNQGSTNDAPFRTCFWYNSSSLQIKFYSLNKLARNSFYQCCATSGTSFYFPSITNSSFDHLGALANMFSSSTSSVVLHFPSNVQSTIEGLTGYSASAPFSSQSGTVLFDLPATVTLTGADSISYLRNPKYDTATALGWRVSTDTDWNPVYTSGTTDPAVSDTIYSDAACTTAVTTISSIA